MSKSGKTSRGNGKSDHRDDRNDRFDHRGDDHGRGRDQGDGHDRKDQDHNTRGDLGGQDHGAQDHTGGSTVTEPTPNESFAKWVLSSGGVSVEVIATILDGNVVFKYQLLSGKADLNGFFIDVNNDGGSITKVGSNANNMNGSDTDGDKLDGFDYAKALGSVGGNDADNTAGTVTVSLSALKITSLDQLANAEIGIRATSVSGAAGGATSLKLADTGEVRHPEPVDLCDRPLDGPDVAGKIEMQDAQITNLTLSFYNVDDGNGGYQPTPGDTSGDWYYTVSINVPAEMGEDPDAYLDQIVALLVEQDPFIDRSDILKSVIVTDCRGDQANYNIADFAQDNPLNPEAPDSLPWTVFNDQDHILTAETDVAGHTEATYTLEMQNDSFAFV
ncbi:hypothetical protein [uncultured Paracoccus sp.]|uniref:hypothetical protein n=1 Tax=uncultured Paracoccus sp. TaxID=189685 RepID=UPI00260295FD|nr:hypothetical protein [uncultured Paracoccus sp.]